MKLELVQVLRGIAALMVVFFHFSVFIDAAIPGSKTLFEAGYLGVDVFFVISGFIIYVSTDKVHARDSKVFLIRRLCRVVLPAWAAMLICAVITPPLLRDLIFGMLFIPSKNLAPPGFGYSFLIVAWTLTYELFFYGIFALSLCLPWSRRHRGAVTASALVVLVAAVQLASHTWTLDAQAGPIFGTGHSLLPLQLISLLGNPILLEFAVGVLFGWMYLAGYMPKVTAPIATVCFVLIAFLIIQFQFRPGHGLSCGGLLSVVVVFYCMVLQKCWDRRGPLAWRGAITRILIPAVFIGDISYSLYLIHPSVKAAFLKFIPKMAGIAHVQLLSMAVPFLATLFLSILFYQFVELPAQRFGRFAASRIRGVGLGGKPSSSI